jgi:hypothetical protein
VAIADGSSVAQAATVSMSISSPTDSGCGAAIEVWTALPERSTKHSTAPAFSSKTKPSPASRPKMPPFDAT